ncbi:LysR substrate-binding domain-containing protein [Cupriavidus sp. DB3]|uniref:LysR substrate-binding domain-containing protein n=1 Tax=Cupriavidus sp. DB3 TaxID=2873259 RepID=UPI0021049775|nr:LysR substrate-binding domain-containing protein [Cupriavidus sp. DB3]
MPILLDLARQYPALELELSFSDRLIDLAEDGYDLAIRTGSLQDRADTIARRVGRQRMIVCASPAYLGRQGEPQSIDDLRQHHAIVYRRSGPVAPWLFPSEDGRPVELRPTGRLMLDDLDAIADAATEGMGVAWLPYWLVRDRIHAGALLQLLPNEPTFLYDAYALWLRTPHLPRKVRLAVDALAADLPRLMQ